MREFINSKIVDNKGRRTNLKTEVARNQSNQFSRKTKKRGGGIVLLPENLTCLVFLLPPF